MCMHVYVQLLSRAGLFFVTSKLKYCDLQYYVSCRYKT